MPCRRKHCNANCKHKVSQRHSQIEMQFKGGFSIIDFDTSGFVDYSYMLHYNIYLPVDAGAASSLDAAAASLRALMSSSFNLITYTQNAHQCVFTSTVNLQRIEGYRLAKVLWPLSHLLRVTDTFLEAAGPLAVKRERRHSLEACRRKFVRS